MIRLPQISEENATQFYNDTYPRILTLLTENEKNLQFQKIIRYCSTAGKLDDKKIKNLLTGDFSTLKKAIDQIGIIEKKCVQGKSPNKVDNPTVNDLFEAEYKKFCSRKLGINWAVIIQQQAQF